MGISATIHLHTDQSRSMEEQRALYLAAAAACAGSVTEVRAVWTTAACELHLTHADGRTSVHPINLTDPRLSFRTARD